MRIDRLFELVHYLLANGSTTAGAFAKRYDVNIRTILRDVETLAAAGIPIYAAKGRGGGIALMDNYTLSKTAMSDEEQSHAATEQADVDRLLIKLRALFAKEDTDWIQADFSRWGDSGEDGERFDTLKQAIVRRQAVRFDYAGSNGDTTTRDVFPLKLVFKSRAWYMQAFCLLRRDYRVFRMTRMFSVKLLPDFSKDKRFDPPPIGSPGTDAAARVRLKIEFSPSAAYRAYDEFGANAVAPQRDGSILVEAELPEDDWLYGFLLSLGASAKVLEPQSVKTRLLERIDAMKNIYSST
jgi:predicted DNA-binding transcriptional regulator YafY